MKITAEPRSDQWNADDFIGGPRDFTIDHVDHGTAEQKYDIHFVGEKRVWRPPLTVLRLLMKAWGDDATVWQQRRVRLFRDDTITFGRDAVGGIRVSHLSHLDGPVTANLTATRGKRASHTVQPLPDAPAQSAEPSAAQVAACTDQKQLREWYKIAGPERQAQILERKADLENEPGAES